MGNEGFSRQLDIVEDRSKESWRDIFAPVHGDNGGPAVGMPQIEMTALLPDSLKSKTFEDADEF